jgi:small subunit ribosomal protein S16
MLAIRMRRAGSKNRPVFRIVVTESKSARDGRFVEVLGHYNPRTKPEQVDIDRERLAHWLGSGAQPSDTVRTLIARDVVEVVAHALAARPDAVVVTEHERRGQTVIELAMAPGELGRVIGRQGRTATALRSLAAAAGELDERRVVVDFRDE